MSQGAIAKLCVSCGVDCAGQPRVKDKNGRYLCKSCYDGKTAARESQTGAYEVAPIETAPAPTVTTTACPECGHVIPTGAVLCTDCGYNVRTGAKSRTTRGTTKATFVRDEEFEADSRDARRKAYLVPAIITLIAGIVLISVIHHNAEPGAFPLLMIFFGVELVLGIAVFFVCSLFWIGIDQPIQLLSLQLAAVYTTTSAIGALMDQGIGGVPIRAGLILGAIYVGLLALLTDIEWVDALGVAVVTIVVKFAIGFAFLYIAAQVLG